MTSVKMNNGIQILLILSILIFMSCTSISTMLIYKTTTETNIDTSSIPGSEVLEVNGGKRTVNGLFWKGDATLVVIFHGNNSTLNDEVQCAKWFMKKGHSVLIPEYPGFGASSRYRANEKRIYSDSANLIQYTQRTFRFNAENTMIVGRSLGAAVAIEMAMRNFGQKLILITPFSSMNDMFIQKGAPRFLVPFINNQRYNNRAKAKILTIPTLIVGCKGDAIIPLTMAIELQKTLRNSSLVIVNSSQHGSIYNDFTEEEIAQIVSF